MRLREVFLALVVAGIATNAGAESGTKDEQRACRPDVRKLCASLGKADEQQYKNCLQYHFGELSPKCAKVMTAHQN